MSCDECDESFCEILEALSDMHTVKALLLECTDLMHFIDYYTEMKNSNSDEKFALFVSECQISNRKQVKDNIDAATKILEDAIRRGERIK